MSHPSTIGIAVLLGPNHIPVGMGILVDQRHVLTCAHVVNYALNREYDATEQPSEELSLEFPFLPGNQSARCSAQVLRWQPTNDWPPSQSTTDTALLHLTAPAPNGTRPARFVNPQSGVSHPFRIYGFPDGPPGNWSKGKVFDRLANGWWRLTNDADEPLSLQEGFSGGGIWDETARGVVGMAVAVHPKKDGVGYMIPTDALRRAYPELEFRSPERPEEEGVSQLAREILSIAIRENAPVQVVKSDGGLVIAVGGASFSKHADQMYAAELRDAVRSLVQKGWLEETEHDMYSVTRTGYQKAKPSNLSDKEQHILTETSKDPWGRILAVRSSHGFHLETNGKQLIEGTNPKLVAAYREALQNLIDLELLEPSGQKGQVFELTKRGWDLAATLTQPPASPSFSSRDEWVKAIREWAASHPSQETEADWSRDSIYSGSGE